jgi:hypothetical protein
MIIVRMPVGKEVEGWSMGDGERDPILLQPDGNVCGAASFLLRGMRASATTAAERAALERGGYLSARLPRARSR